MKTIYDRAYFNLILKLQHALKEEYLKDEDINGSLETLQELICLSSPRRARAERDGIGDASIPYGSYDFYTFVCPNCDEEIENVENEPNYCVHCGQRLEWGEDDD